MTRPSRLLLKSGAIALIALAAPISGCSLFDPEPPSAEVMEAEIARCLGFEPDDVNFTWNEDETAFTIGTNGGQRVDPDQQTACINDILNG